MATLVDLAVVAPATHSLVLRGGSLDRLTLFVLLPLTVIGARNAVASPRANRLYSV